MPSAKQIKARKAFARKYAKKGKRKAKSKKPKPKRTSRTVKSGKRKDWDVEITETDYGSKWDKKMQEFLNKSNNES